MNKYELLIACRDEPEAHRKNEGDIIDVKPSPWEWGRKETCRFLVVPVLASSSFKEMRGFRAAGPGKKRRFQIPLDILIGWYPDLDFKRVRDAADHYQPFRDRGIVIDMTDKVAVVKDKTKGTFKYGKFKTAAE